MKFLAMGIHLGINIQLASVIPAVLFLIIHPVEILKEQPRLGNIGAKKVLVWSKYRPGCGTSFENGGKYVTNWPI
jgi:hypothetical protein